MPTSTSTDSNVIYLKGFQTIEGENIFSTADTNPIKIESFEDYRKFREEVIYNAIDMYGTKNITVTPIGVFGFSVTNSTAEFLERYDEVKPAAVITYVPVNA